VVDTLMRNISLILISFSFLLNNPKSVYYILYIYYIVYIVYST
jgi:hypothetical protein